METGEARDAGTRRRERTRQDILAAAWALAERDGVAGLSLRDLAAEVGMRAPSLYTYFSSKGDIHDAMFAQGYDQLLAASEQLAIDPDDVPGTLTRVLESFLAFCQASVPRYQLMFTRVVPGWEPTPVAYARSQQVLDRLASAFADLGLAGDRAVDLWTALVSGLAAQQVANDLGGDRWVRLVPDAVEMFLAHHDRNRSRA